MAVSAAGPSLPAETFRFLCKSSSTVAASLLSQVACLQWWNPTIEEQAIDRAHRIGQTRTVHVTRITIAGIGLPPHVLPMYHSFSVCFKGPCSHLIRPFCWRASIWVTDKSRPDLTVYAVSSTQCTGWHHQIKSFLLGRSRLVQKLLLKKYVGLGTLILHKCNGKIHKSNACISKHLQTAARLHKCCWADIHRFSPSGALQPLPHSVEQLQISCLHKQVHVSVLSVFELCCFAGTVEERILALQDSKRKIVSAAFDDDSGSPQQSNRLTKEDLHFLFTGQR